MKFDSNHARVAAMSIKREPEHQGPIWTHPYVVYMVITVLLFLFVGFMGWLAKENDWIPKSRLPEQSAP
jgi:hypothetical protein